ncbi:MAG: hypothetical protein GWN64_16845 [Candidatus Thorarchaeota archaeon]|nr:hypothetical protein [Candidatus Thorarchaeota archaeon]
MSKVKDEIVLRKEIRESALGELNAKAPGITESVLDAVPTDVSATYVEDEVQAIADAVIELSKLIKGS